jgi:hypothetical protein
MRFDGGNLEVVILDIESWGLDLNQGYSEYDPEMLSFQPRRPFLENAAIIATECISRVLRASNIFLNKSSDLASAKHEERLVVADDSYMSQRSWMAVSGVCCLL